MRYRAILVTAMACTPALVAQRLTLGEAQHLAIERNRSLKLARLKVEENEHKRLGARSDYFPKVLADTNYLYFSEKLGTSLNAGDIGLGILPPPLPSIPIPINLVKQNLLFGGATVAQPVTQLWRVRQGLKAAASEEEISRAQLAKGQREVAYAVEQLYYGVLVSARQKNAAELKITAAEEQLKDARNAVDKGTALAVAAIGRRAAVLEARQSLLMIENQMSDYREAFNSLLGLPVATQLELVEPPRPAPVISSADEAVQIAIRESPEAQEAARMVEKAHAGVTAARAEYIPDVTIIGQYFYQTGIPTLPGSFAAIGGRASYTLFDFGKRRELVKQRRSQLEQAEENLRRVREELEVAARKGYRNLEQSLAMIGTAREAEQLRVEGERLNLDQFELGLALKSAYLESQAARASAEADLLRAEVGWRLAYAELKRLIGRK